MRKPTSRGFRKCGTFWVYDFLKGSYWLSKSSKVSKNKNTKCPIDAHCHRHCRKDLRITEDYLEFNMNSEIRFYKFVLQK